MFNWKKMTMILMVAVMMLSGCTKSNIVSPEGGTIAGDGRPDTEVKKDIKVDWTEVREDLRDSFMDPYGQFADVVMYLDARYDEASGLLTVVLPVNPKTTADVATLYGQAVLVMVGESVATQDFNYEGAAENENGDLTGYGTFFDDHDVCVQVFPYDKENDTSAYLVNDTMKAGEQRALEATAQ